MSAHPVGRWVVDTDAIPVLDVASVSLVREEVRARGARAGMPEVATAALVSAASELAHNQLAHARDGFVSVGEVSRGEERGVEVVAADAGPGILDVASALEGRARGGASLGVGLSAVMELADEVDVDVRLSEGTYVRARKFARVERRRPRVGIYGRAFPGERTSGDDAAFARTGQSLVVGVADGLGHGEAAREASERARGVLLAQPDLAPEAILACCHAELARTRGAVMSVARIDEERGEVSVACVGNVGVMLVGPRGTTRFGGLSFVLGSPGSAPRIVTERRAMDARDVLVLFSDGVSSRVDLSCEHAVIREHPVIIAQHVVERFARDNDDATVLVVA